MLPSQFPTSRVSHFSLLVARFLFPYPIVHSSLTCSYLLTPTPSPPFPTLLPPPFIVILLPLNSFPISLLSPKHLPLSNAILIEYSHFNLLLCLLPFSLQFPLCWPFPYTSNLYFQLLLPATATCLSNSSFIHSFIADIYIAPLQVVLFRSAPNPSVVK